MKPQDDQEPLIPPDASISNPARAQSRLRGSHSSQQPLIARRRPPGDGDDGPPDGDGEPPPPPPPPVSVPDVAMQFSPCLPDAVRADVVRAIRDATGGTADVRALCQNQSERIGLWFRPVVNPDDNAARDRGLQRLNLLQVGETVVFFINSSLIYRTAFDAWNQQPRRLNGDGNPDPNGPIHLTSFSVSFESPNRVVTRIGGFDERPWPDVDFTVAITDTLALSAGGVRCDSVTTLDADTSWLNFLTGLFLIVFPPLGAVFLVERIIVGAADAPELGAGPGCSAAAMIFGEIMIPRGLKVVLSYQRLNVGTGGIFAGGSFAIVPRTPEVFLNGPTQISVPEGTSSVVRTYGVRTEDLRGSLHIVWSGDGVALHQGAPTTAIRFNLGSTSPGQVVTQRVAVRVTDVDGLAAEAALIVSVHVVPQDDDDFPPVCKHKPWLPQCQEPMARLRGGRAPHPDKKPTPQPA
jgi:hypothetical protein